MNYQAIICGPPGCGKTTLAASLVRRHLEKTRGIVLAFDPFAQFAKHGCHSFRDADAWRVAASVATSQKKPFPRGASIGGEASHVTMLAVELGERMNRAGDVRVPILLPYDEGSLLDTSGSTYVGTIDNRMQAARRHLGVSPVYNLQQPSQLTERFWSMCTDAYLFRQTADRAQQLEKYLLLERGELARAGITRLPAYRYLHVQLGAGLVGGAL